MSLVSYSYATHMYSCATRMFSCATRIYSCGVLLTISKVIIQVFSQINSGPAVFVFTDRQLSCKMKECYIYQNVFFYS